MMRTLEENLELLRDNKASIKEAIENKMGGTITDTMSDWPDIIKNLTNNVKEVLELLLNEDVGDDVSTWGDKLKSAVIDLVFERRLPGSSVNKIIKYLGTKHIGSGAFAGIKSVKLEIEEGYTNIEIAAFYLAYLTKVFLPSTMTLIEPQVFYGVNGLTAMIIRAITPPLLKQKNAFQGTYPIYVPDESVEAYKEATNWNSLAERIKPISEYEENN